MNNMPMPGMPESNENQVSSDASSETTSSQVAPEVTATTEGATLDAPTHEEEVNNRPDYVGNGNISNESKIPKTPKGGIKVVATRKGFYNQMRIAKGDKFTVAKFEDLGLWMKCEDSALEKKRQEALKDKKYVARRR